MALAALSAEKRINDKLNSLGMTARALSACVGLSNSRLNDALNGIRPLENEQATRVLNCLAEIESLVQDLSPVLPALSNAEDVKAWLELRRRGLLRIIVERYDIEESGVLFPNERP